MAVQTMNANEARKRWRDVIDAVQTGQSVIVERFGKPVAAVISYEDYVAALETIEEERDIREAEAELEAYRRDPAGFRSLDDIESEMRDKGLLDG